VTEQDFVAAPLPDKFEVGTPNLNGALSLLKAFEYIESIGGYETLESIEQELVNHTLKKFQEINSELQKLSLPEIRLVG
jgi:cysteine desulfurase / selenocysteine lyase